MMLKDVDLVLERARETGVTLPFTQELRALLEQTAEGGYADADFMALYLRLRRSQARGDDRGGDMTDDRHRSRRP